MLGVVVNGGTNAGRRIVREPARRWAHVCAANLKPVGAGVILEACVTRCPACGCKRPS